VILFKWQ